MHLLRHVGSLRSPRVRGLVAARRISSLSQAIDLPPAPSRSEINETIAEAEARALRDAQAKRVQHMPIRAVHLARKMDTVALFQKLYTDKFKVAHFLHKDSVVLRLSGSHDHANIVTGVPIKPPTLSAPVVADTGLQKLSLPGNVTSRRAKDKWIVYFDYGAVVFFNCDQQLINTLTKHAKRFCQDVFEMRGHDEELLLVGNPALDKWSNLSDNQITVREIDHINIHVIAGVLAQTVAMEHYERQIEAILSEFEKLNTAVERNGPRGALFGIGIGDKQTERQQHKKLFQIVATNNTLLIDLVSKLRVIDRKRPGDAAWSHTRYHTMWESLVEDFELSERFNNLNFKLELIQHNTKFFLEVLGTHKGERMEWYIIILIAAELLISLYEFIMKLREEPEHMLPFYDAAKHNSESSSSSSSESAPAPAPKADDAAPLATN
ncbi:hypothetical protein P43SY_009826 [Pythium insidiosum]|uniref:DUF155 domain-containing protein n=1 Tax=Pythium insidiosum TaxID=114742 RepID=A0AAD5LF33_PYTIN|nr:hypothetical protein P43SY_009826 [Pythium insidiosum]